MLSLNALTSLIMLSLNAEQSLEMLTLIRMCDIIFSSANIFSADGLDAV
jgi:hypothetical protein